MRTLIVLVLSITSACTSDPVADACQRADQCNALNGSVEECTDNFTTALDRLSSSDQDEYRHAIQDCLDHPSCGGFVSCINTVLGN